MTPVFTGFSPHALAFFQNLAANNNKPWFEAHRGDYEEFLLEPLKGLVTDLAPAMLAIDADLVTLPAVDRTISRIYRDIRFSRNKSPYKTCLWITFRRQRPDWKDCPCFFCEISADAYRYGMGYYSASRETMDSLRAYIEQKPDDFREIAAGIARDGQFMPEGERYKRPLNPALADDLQEWHRRKNIYLICTKPCDGRLFTREIFTELRDGFLTLAPLYELFWKVRR